METAAPSGEAGRAKTMVLSLPLSEKPGDKFGRYKLLQDIKAGLAKLRYFVGMAFEEAAEVLGISVATANRHWAYGRAFLFDEIRGNRTK